MNIGSETERTLKYAEMTPEDLYDLVDLSIGAEIEAARENDSIGARIAGLEHAFKNLRGIVLAFKQNHPDHPKLPEVLDQARYFIKMYGEEIRLPVDCVMDRLETALSTVSYSPVTDSDRLKSVTTP